MENRLAKLKLDDTLNEDAVRDKSMEIERECENHTTELNNIFAKVDDRRRVSNSSLQSSNFTNMFKPVSETRST